MLDKGEIEKNSKLRILMERETHQLKALRVQEKQHLLSAPRESSRVSRRTEKAVAMEGEGSDGHVPGCTSDTAGS